MSGDWKHYFKRRTVVYNTNVKYYEYKDKSVKSLPANLPMPPTKTLYRMFQNCTQIQDITALADWDVSNVENMSGMFGYCNQLEDITALANWNVSKVEDMENLFSNCNQLQDITALANWDVSNVRSMSGIFRECYQLQDITALANWVVSNAWNVSCMFYGCGQLNVSSDTNDIESYLRLYPKQDHTQLLQSLWERVKPLLKDTTKLNGYFKRYDKYYIHIEDLPSDWQNIELPQWDP